MTTEYTGEAFRPIFNAAMAAWWDGNCEGVCPADNWESKSTNCEWRSSSGKPFYYSNILYRWKPAPKRMVTIGYLGDNGNWLQQTLVAPETVAPNKFEKFFYSQFGNIHDGDWVGADWQTLILKNKELFLTQEDAQAMADWQAKCRGGAK